MFRTPEEVQRSYRRYPRHYWRVGCLHRLIPVCRNFKDSKNYGIVSTYNEYSLHNYYDPRYWVGINKPGSKAYKWNDRI